MGAPERSMSDRELSDPSIVRVRAVIEAGLAALEERREEVNHLNLGGGAGVLDGDTGDNMVLTLRAVLDELDRVTGGSAGRTIDEIGRGEIVASVARAALLGARGRSGVILSQLIRGAAEELASRPGELIDPVLIGAALARAADQAYGSVRDPAEGTILTVVREMAYRVASELAHRPEARLRPETTALEQDLAIAEVIQSALEAGEDSVSRGPERMRALRDAGVVDAGGYGLVVLMAGIVAALRGAGAEASRPAPELPDPAPPPHTSITYRYCTSFAVIGRELSPRSRLPDLEAIGDAVLVVGDAATLKVHVHTDDPRAATALFAAAGTVSHLEVADMRPAAAVEAAPAPVSGLVALADGAGLRELFEAFGARVVSGAGDQTVPALLEAIAGVGTPEVVLLLNGVVAPASAQAAAAASAIPVEILATDSPPAGLAAAAAHVPARGAVENTAAMSAAVARLRTGSVAAARADDREGRFRAGEAVGRVDAELVAWGGPAMTLRAVLARLSAGAEIVSVLSGAAPPLSEAEVSELAAAVAGGVGVTQSVGGQPTSWWLLSAQ
jgi:DAK2 domain fusion protein YloV